MYPSHIAIIPDGNRRWAKKYNKSLKEAYITGAKKVEEVIGWWTETPSKILSIYTLSYENFIRRSRTELKILFRILNKELNKLKKGKFFKKLMEKGVKVIFAGLLKLLPEKLYLKIQKVMELYKENSERKLYFLLVYGGRQEILNALGARTGEEFRERLWVKEDVDLIIRTGGYHRLSNLLLYQSAYAEIYVTEKLWPEFEKIDFLNALRWYASIQRNFGH